MSQKDGQFYDRPQRIFTGRKFELESKGIDNVYYEFAPGLAIEFVRPKKEVKGRTGRNRRRIA